MVIVCLHILYEVVGCNSNPLLSIQWTWTGEKNSRRIRENYFKAILRQDITFFDNLGAGAVATRIQSDTRTLIIDLISTSC